jgi:plasmid stabilization system protein ParE
MMRILFRKEAETDLELIASYYDDVAPDSVNNVLADIYRSIDQLVHFPQSGMRVPDRQFRRIDTLKYHFKIASEETEGNVVILGIFRYQDREV